LRLVAAGEEQAKLRTRVADRINAVVWRLPLPRRAVVALSQLVYRNPPISLGRMLGVLRALDGAGVKMVLIGGWGIDALFGYQLRPHADLDLIVEQGQIGTALAALEGLGFKPWHANETPGTIGKLDVFTTVAFRDGALRVVELHESDLGGLQTAAGQIAGKPVLCLPAEVQLQAQEEMGRTWVPQRRLRKKRNVAAVEGALQRRCENA
jgi:lincosamide nucleotidyltransferase A/C/D/E